MKYSTSLLILLFFSFSISLNSSLNSQWLHSSNGMHSLTVYSLAVQNNKIIAGTPLSLSVSTNFGANWYQTMFNSQEEPVHSIYVNQNNVYCGVEGYGLTASINGGVWYWHHPLGNRTIYSLTYSNGKLFAGASAYGDPAGVYISINDGYGFTQTTLVNKTVLALASGNNTIFAGTSGEGVYTTTNDGVNWLQTPLNNQSIMSLAVSGNFIYAGSTGNGVFVSSNSGANWSQTSLTGISINSLAVNGNSVFAGSSGNSNFYVSTNNGTNWILKNTGIENQTVSSLCILNSFIYAGTLSNGLYKISVSELTGIQAISNQVPERYELSQNYPNPFNPSTKIRFQIPVGNGRDRSELVIYDALGRKVNTLVNEQLNAGIYEVDWNASENPSGVYFYKLISGGFAETKKMLLVK